MNKDFELLREIFIDLNYTESYTQMIINYLKKEYEESDFRELTPHFIYTKLIFEEGRERAKIISEYFEEMKEKGYYTPIAMRNYKKEWD